MPLTTGTRLGPYEISGTLGAGGMGEVYRARDSRLNRDVAIKTLPAAFTDNTERMARFQREAQMLAALNHPNIAAIYGIEQSALVMELVEGKDLAGPLPVDQAMAIARQIAGALDAAHQKNIIHRDLKPANVKITPEGSVKLLDFGLAKAFDGGTATSDPANSPTLSMESTRAGVILGTAGYMSPEQARGKAVDKRADIWSFGVVFFELLTGERAFPGETVSDTLAAVLKTDPDWSKLPDHVPDGVRRLLHRCLERDANKRLRDIGDAWIEMDGAVESRPARSAKLPAILGAVAGIAAAAAILGWLRSPVTPLGTVTRSEASMGPSFYPNLSRDGTRLVYLDNTGTPHLCLRMMDQVEGKPIPGGENGGDAAFSPDGQWIAYISFPGAPKLKKIPAAGGTPIVLSDVPGPGTISWDLDDSIVLGSSQGLLRVPAAGGPPQPLTAVDTKTGELLHSDAQVLPGRKTILFTIAVRPGATRIAVLDLGTGKYRVVVKEGNSARYVPTGHLVYIRGETLFAAPFDLKRLATTGSETPVMEGISLGQYTFSDSSLLVFGSGGAVVSPATFEWTDRTGAGQALPEPPHHWMTWALSPDGKLVAGQIRGDSSGSGRSDIWIYDLERRTMARLTFEGSNTNPVWTPDGKWVTFSSSRDGKHGIYRVAADKSGEPELLLTTGNHVYPGSWTPDGKALLYTQYTTPDDRGHIWLMPAPGRGGESAPRPFSRTPYGEKAAKVSPEGSWVAYVSDETGNEEVYLVPFPGPGGKSQISLHGGSYPAWSHDGRELYYVQPGTRQVMEVDIPPGLVLRVGTPRALFNADWGFGVAPDGKHFMVERRPEKSRSTTFVTITNWFDDLRRRAPTK